MKQLCCRIHPVLCIVTVLSLCFNLLLPIFTTPIARAETTPPEAVRRALAANSTATFPLVPRRARVRVHDAGHAVAATLGAFLSWDYNNLSNQASTSTLYQVLGRPKTVTPPDGMATHYEYRVGRVAVLDANGHQKNSDSDALGRLTHVYEYDGWYGAISWEAAGYAMTQYNSDNAFGNARNVSRVVHAISVHGQRVT